jgi:hypothetical protein
MKDEDYVVRAFMDGVDWQHELGAALGGNRLYPDAKDCKENRPCTRECGIVEVEVRFIRWVEPQNFGD